LANACHIRAYKPHTELATASVTRYGVATSQPVPAGAAHCVPSRELYSVSTVQEFGWIQQIHSVVHEKALALSEAR
jgi:hypothetical protein